MAEHKELFERRREYSKSRLTKLAETLKGQPQVTQLPGLAIYATGSYARNEASMYSDVDLFFVQAGSADPGVSNLDRLVLFGRIIETVDEMGFPPFSNDGEFLKVLYLDDMRERLGGRLDDSENYFTARMLLLLESRPLVNDREYEHMVSEIVETYYRDFPNHAEDFRPVFLINDILRFWKTLCLNYEHRRNKLTEDPIQRRKQQVRNFKLKFSRLMSCFGTVIAVCAIPAPITKEQVVALTCLSPLERFLHATSEIGELGGVRQEILDDYAWFMAKTELPADDLAAAFESHEEKVELFGRAAKFGERMYDALALLASRNHYSRYLVI